MKKIYIELIKKYMDLSVLHIDFHTTPHFGDSNEMEINQLASDLNIKIDFDTFLTQIAHTLYRLMAKNLQGYENSEPETLYKEFIQGWVRIYNSKDKIIVCLSKKRATGCLMNAQFLGSVLQIVTSVLIEFADR